MSKTEIPARKWTRAIIGLMRQIGAERTWGRTGQAGLVTLPVPLVETAAGEIALTLDSPPDLVLAHGFALATAAPALHIRRRACITCRQHKLNKLDIPPV